MGQTGEDCRNEAYEEIIEIEGMLNIIILWFVFPVLRYTSTLH